MKEHTRKEFLIIFSLLSSLLLSLSPYCSPSLFPFTLGCFFFHFSIFFRFLENNDIFLCYKPLNIVSIINFSPNFVIAGCNFVSTFNVTFSLKNGVGFCSVKERELKRWR